MAKNMNTKRIHVTTHNIINNVAADYYPDAFGDLTFRLSRDVTYDKSAPPADLVATLAGLVKENRDVTPTVLSHIDP